MAHRNIHYEAAFEDYLQARGWPYVAVDEAKRSAFSGVGLKNFDFVVYSQTGRNLLIDVKGRKFPDPAKSSGRAWENWITREDLDSLVTWQGVFGEDFWAVLVFAYWYQGPPERSPFDELHFFRQRSYAFVAIDLDSYREGAKPRSAKWQTLTMPTGQFSRNVRDIAEFL